MHFIKCYLNSPQRQNMFFITVVNFNVLDSVTLPHISCVNFQWKEVDWILFICSKINPIIPIILQYIRTSLMLLFSLSCLYQTACSFCLNDYRAHYPFLLSNLKDLTPQLLRVAGTPLSVCPLLPCCDSYHPDHDVGEAGNPQGGADEGQHKIVLPARWRAVGDGKV